MPSTWDALNPGTIELLESALDSEQIGAIRLLANEDLDLPELAQRLGVKEGTAREILESAEVMLTIAVVKREWDDA